MQSYLLCVKQKNLAHFAILFALRETKNFKRKHKES